MNSALLSATSATCFAAQPPRQDRIFPGSAINGEDQQSSAGGLRKEVAFHSFFVGVLMFMSTSIRYIAGALLKRSKVSRG